MSNNLKTEKIITRYWDQIDPLNVDSYVKKGGYLALRKVIREISEDQAVGEVKKSGLRGRGGAGYPAGEKWEMARKNKNKKRVVIANLDESEPGNFKDRILAEKNPHQLLEGLAIASFAVGAKQAFIYLNGNFSLAKKVLAKAIEQANKRNFLGRNVWGSYFDLEVQLFVGAGAYICGEETALINSMEGRRGEPSGKPPFPCDCGLAGNPTVVNNAETLANLPWIIQNGGEKFAQIGMKDSTGTKLFSIDGAVKRPGLYEAPMGTTLRELISEYAGGLSAGSEFWFAQIGGSSGHLAPAAFLNEIPSYSPNSKLPVGSGSVLVVDKNRRIEEILYSWISFFCRESCGKCVPCREGTFRLKILAERLKKGIFDSNDWEDMEKILWVLENTTFCALGKFAAVAWRDAIKFGFLKKK